MPEIKIPISETGLEEPKKHISITRVQYALVNPDNGHIHAWGGLDTICRVWDIEHNEIGSDHRDDLKLEVRETNLVEIKTLSIDEIKRELKRQSVLGIKYN